MSSVNGYKRMLNEKGKDSCNNKGRLQWSSERRVEARGSPVSCSAQHEGVQTGNVLALLTETSPGTKDTIHEATKA